ncbi:putative chloroplast-targeted copper chaperone [Corchorus olitorius]|uniref:Chloroplast-targeted copper chaperone n=1 Tax=Corchorus olitorius TaxID=93759 RepID=A0A1R3IZT1_9ROSI|nr:putative chloroplast-targeted copper chaperone [Corchorus olitorius]
MGLSGFHGNGGNVTNAAAALGGNPNAIGGYHQVQSNNGLQGSSATSYPNGGYATGGGQYPSSMLMNMNGYNYPSSMINMMNLQNRHAAMQQQPQMMYHRSPLIPPNTGYYYNYGPPPYSYPEVPNYNNTTDHSAATHMFSDDNTSSSCSIM